MAGLAGMAGVSYTRTDMREPTDPSWIIGVVLAFLLGAVTAILMLRTYRSMGDRTIR